MVSQAPLKLKFGKAYFIIIMIITISCTACCILLLPAVYLKFLHFPFQFPGNLPKTADLALDVS